DAKNVGRIGRRCPEVAPADCESRCSSTRERKRRRLRYQRERVELEERRGSNLQGPQILPAFCERAHRCRELSAQEDAAAAPVKRDNQARPGSAAADVLDGGEQPLAHVRQVRRLSAEEDPALDRARGEIETEERSVADGSPRTGEREPERSSPTREAADAGEALAAVAADAPDAVLLDVQLPDRDGFAVATALAAIDGPAVVLISSREADAYGKRIAACGARGFIPKSKLSAAAFAAL